MEKLVLLLVAMAMVLLGARGTYKAVWNSFFPNDPIITTPVSTLPGGLSTVPGANVPKGASTSQNQSPSGYATNPNEVGQQAAKSTQNWISGVLSGAASGATNAAHVVPGPGGVYNPEIIGQSGGQYRNTTSNNSSRTGTSPYTGQSYGPQPYPKNTGKPSWWPSWLLWPGDLATYQGG